MRTISLRQFRDSIPDLHEQVVVQRRRQDGEYETLGQWTPLRQTTAAGVFPNANTVYRGTGLSTAMAQAERAEGDDEFHRKSKGE